MAASVVTTTMRPEAAIKNGVNLFFFVGEVLPAFARGRGEDVIAYIVVGAFSLRTIIIRALSVSSQRCFLFDRVKGLCPFHSFKVRPLLVLVKEIMLDFIIIMYYNMKVRSRTPCRKSGTYFKE